MVILVTYDVVGNRERTRFFKRLKGLLTPVQKSVFEGDLPTRRFGVVERLIHRELNLETDSVRVYSMCKGCAGLLRTYGVTMEVPDPEEPMLF